MMRIFLCLFGFFWVRVYFTFKFCFGGRIQGQKAEVRVQGEIHKKINKKLKKREHIFVIKCLAKQTVIIINILLSFINKF